MLSFLRKHTGLIMFVLAFVFVGLAFFGDNMSFGAPGSGARVMTTKSGSYNEKEYNKLGIAAFELSTRLQSLFPMLSILSTAPDINTKNSPVAYFANRIILREEAEKLGLVPSREQIEAKIQSMPEFQTSEGIFDPQSYRRFATKVIGRYGLTESDFFDLVKDSLSFDRIVALLTSGVALDERFVGEEFNSLAQVQDLKTATLTLEHFKNADSTVDEETLKTYWEPRKNQYMSDETRSVVVYTMEPTAKAEKPAGGSAIPLVSQQIGEVAEGVWEKVVNKQKGADLDKVIKEMSAQKKDLFTLKEDHFKDISQKALPDLLKKGFNPAAGQQGTLGDAVFHITPSGELADHISNVLIMDDGSVVLFQLEDKVNLSQPLEFAQARERALADYRRENDTKNLDLAAETLRKDLSEGLKEGKDFKALAEKGKAVVKEMGEVKFSPQEELFFAARLVNPGEVTKVVKQGDDMVVAELVSRSIEESPATASQRAMFKGQKNSEAASLLFQDWFNTQFRNRDIKFTEAMLKANQRNR